MFILYLEHSGTCMQMTLREFVCYGDLGQLPKESSYDTKEKAQPRWDEGPGLSL